MFIPNQKIVVSLECSPAAALQFYEELREWAEPKLAEIGNGSISASVCTGVDVEAPATPSAA